ncbi:MAG TPA: hypothetical protein VMS55_22275 [Myxococcota bacterium]|nr:hypothetical protein [Myxococcota bacterium]
MAGEAMPFPVITGAWIAWSGDGVSELEVIPCDMGFEPNRVPGKEPVAVPGLGLGPGGWHVALSTTVPANEVLRIAREAGWPAQICDRAGYFSLVEVWVDGVSSLEILDPKMLARYNETFTADTWRQILRDFTPAESGPEVIEILRARNGD